MEKPPMEWIVKLFVCLSDFYGDRFSKKFDRWYSMDFARTQWQSALTGLTYEQIRNALVYFRQKSQSPYNDPPSHMEFFSMAKNYRDPEAARIAASTQANKELARRSIQRILGDLRNKGVKVDAEISKAG